MKNLLLIDFNIYDRDFITSSILPNTIYVHINSSAQSYYEIYSVIYSNVQQEKLVSKIVDE
jgi:hypothetical protein